MMNRIKALLKDDVKFIEHPDGVEMHGRLKANNEEVHIMRRSGVMFVAVGEVPAHGSPPLSDAEALAIIEQAAR